MKLEKIDAIALALAGIVQALYLVNELARHGSANEDAIAVSINSITKLDSNTVSEIYGDPQGVRLGLVQLEKLLKNPAADAQKNLLRYVVNVFALSKRLLRSPLILEKLRKNLENVQRQISYFSPQHETVVANLSSAYIETQGELRQRIIVLGKEQYLKTTDIQTKIRVLLLAALRSAVLWQQLDGSRLKLFLQRKKLLQACQRMTQGS